MGEEIKPLYDWLVANKILQNVGLGEFSSDMEDPRNRKRLHETLSKSGQTKKSYDEFEQQFFVSVKKKDTGAGGSPAPGDGSGQSNVSVPIVGIPGVSEPFAETPKPVPTPAAPSPSVPPIPESKYGLTVTDYSGAESTGQGFSFTPPPQAPRVSAADDPATFGETYRQKNEADYDKKRLTTELSRTRQQERVLENITLYGKEALTQVQDANYWMSEKFGMGWKDELANLYGRSNDLALKSQTTPLTPDEQAEYDQTIGKISNIEGSPEYLRLREGMNAYDKAMKAYDFTLNRSNKVQAQMRMTEEAQAEVDRLKREGGALNNIRLAMNYAMRKSGQTLAGLMQAPRTLEFDPISYLGKIGGHDMDVAGWLGSWGDELSDYSAKKYPAPSKYQVGVFNKSADFKGFNVFVDDRGEIVRVTDKDGYTVKTDKKFETEFRESGKGKLAATGKDNMAGVGVIANKTMDAIVDIYLMRALGQGTKVGTLMTSFAQSNGDAYREAIKDYNMTVEEASAFATTTAMVQGVIEAYVGSIETTLGKPAVQQAMRLGKSQAKALVGKASPVEIAWQAMRPVVSEIAQENGEEILQSVSDQVARFSFNTATGANLKTGINAQELKETILLTSLATSGPAGLQVRNNVNAWQANAMLTAAGDPERYAKLLDELHAAGKLSAEELTAQKVRGLRLAKIRESLPNTLSEEDMARAIAIQDYRDAQAAVAENKEVPTGQRNLADARMKEADTALAQIVETAGATDAPAGEPASTPEQAIQAEVQAIVEDAQQQTEPGAPIEEPSLVSPQPEPPAEPGIVEPPAVVMPPVSDQQTPIEEPQEQTPETVLADAIEEVQARGYQVTPEIESTAQSLVEASLDPQNNPAPSTDIATQIAEEIITDLEPVQQVTEGERQPGLAGDIAAFFQKGGKIARADYLLAGGRDKTSDGKRVTKAYFGGKANLERHARLMAQKNGVSFQEARAAIVKHIMDNPRGPGDAYMASKQARAQEVEDQANEDIINNAAQTLTPEEQQGVTKMTPAERRQVAQDVRSRVESAMQAMTEEDAASLTEALSDFYNQDGTLSISELNNALREWNESGTGLLADALRDNPAAATIINNAISDAETSLTDNRGQQNAQSAGQQTQAQARTTEQNKGRQPVGTPASPSTVSPEEAITAVDLADTPEAIAAAEAMLEEAIANAPVPEQLTPELLGDMVRGGQINPYTALAAAAYLQGSELPEHKAEHDRAVGILQTNPGLSKEAAATIAAIESQEKLEEQKKLSTNVDNTVDNPIVVGSHGEIIVRKATPFRDQLRDAGGTWIPGKGWVFPASKENEVRAIIGANPLNATTTERTDVSGGGMTGRLMIGLRRASMLFSMRRMERQIAASDDIDAQIDAAAEFIRLHDTGGAAAAQRAIDTLAKAFPGVSVVTDPNKVAAAAEKLGTSRKPLGFVVDGKVYIDMERAGGDTPMHEFGHVWAMLSKAHNLPLHKEGMDAMRGSEYEAAVRESDMYRHLTEEADILEEALALAIGERGARFLQRDPWRRFQRLLIGVWDTAQRVLGVRPNNMTAYQFADYMAGRMLSGNAMFQETSNEISRIQNEQAKYLFLGEDGANGAVKDNLSAARIMEEQGHPNETIRRATAWFRGVDDQWRFEIDDSKMTLSIDPSTVEEGEVIDLGLIVDHPGLFNAYPGLREMSVLFISPKDMQEDAMMVKAPGGWMMVINRSATDDLKLSILHEIQHYIQVREAFAFGTGENIAKRQALGEINAITQMISRWPQGAAKQMELTRLRTIYDAYQAGVKALYQRSAGEVEARAVEARSSMSEQERMAVPPEASMDVDPAHQVVIFNAGEVDMDGPVEYGDLPMNGPARYQFGLNQAVYAHRMKAARQIIRADLRRTGGQNQVKIIEGLAKKLGMEKTIVEHIWAAEAKQNGMGKFAIRQGGKFSWSNRIAEIKKYMGPTALEWFHFKGELPQAMFEATQARQGLINKFTVRAENQISDLRKAIKATYGKETDTVLQHINNVLAGDADILTLPLAMRPAVRNLRGTINELSKALLDSGAIKGQTIVTVLKNMGVEVNAAGELEIQQVSDILNKPPYERSATEQQMAEAFIERYQKKFGNYLTRSYAMYSNKNWQRNVNRDTILINRVKRYLGQNLQKAVDAITSKTTDKIAALETEIKDILDGMQREADDLKAAGLLPEAQEMQDLIDKDAPLLMGMSADDLKAIKEFWETSGIDIPDEIAAIRDKRARITSIEQMMRDNEGMSPDAVQALRDRINDLDSEIESILTVDDVPEAWIKRGKLGSKDMRILQKRGQIPGVIRELMGEYRDPQVNAFKSVVRMVNLVANQTFLNDMRSKYEGTLFFDPNKPKPAGAFVQIASEGSRTLAPLNGWYTTPAIKRAMERYFDSFERAPWERWWVSNIVYLVKANLTSLNPVGITRNFWSNVVSMAANGWNPAHTFKLASDLYTGKQDRQKVRERLYELQVLGESVDANEVKEYIAGLEERWPWIRDNMVTKPLYMFQDGMKFLYEWGDLIFRVTGFETEKRQAAKQMYGKRFDALNDQERDVVERRAAKMVNHLSPTHSYVPKIARRVRANPIVGTFVSWPAEQVRITYNQISLSIEEIRDQKRVGRGALRMASLIAAHSLGVATMLISRHLVGVDDDEDQARIELGNPFDKNAIVMYLPSKKEGQVKYVNVSYMYPYAWYQKPFISGLMTSSQDGSGLLERIGRTAWGFLEPYMSWDVAFLSTLQLATNVDITRKEDIRNETLPWYNPYNVEKTIEFTQKKMGPGFINSINKIRTAAAGEYDDYGNLQNMQDVLFEHLLGVKVRNFDPMISFEQRLKRWQDQKNSGTQIFTRAASRADNSYARLLKSGASPEELAAYKAQQEERLSHNKEVAEVAYQQSLLQLATIFKAAAAVAPGTTAEERQNVALEIAKKYTTDKELVALIQNLPLKFEPKHKKGSIFR